MKIKKMIKKLQEFDPELEVLTAQDPEGNGYSRVMDVDIVEPEYNKPCCMIWPEDEYFEL